MSGGNPQKKPGIYRRPIILFKVGAILFIAAIILEVWMVNRLSTYGEKISEMESKKSALILENELLQNTLAEYKSLGDIQKKANFIGFSNFTKVEYIKEQK